jgi:integrase
LKALREHRTRTSAAERHVDSICGELVFTRHDGRWVHPDRFSQMFDKHVRSAQLKRIRFHDVRHTYATLALTAGVHPKIVSERLGHATVAFTLDVYSHVIPGMQEDAASLVAGLILG